MICDWLQCCTCSQSYQQLLTQIWIQRHGILDKDEYRKCWEEMLGGKGGLSVSSRTWGTFPDTQSRLSMLAPSRGARGWWRTWTSELMCKEGETNVKRAGGLQAIQRDQRKPERWTWRLYWSPFLKPDRPGDEVCRALIVTDNASSSALKLSQPIKLNIRYDDVYWKDHELQQFKINLAFKSCCLYLWVNCMPWALAFQCNFI